MYLLFILKFRITINDKRLRKLFQHYEFVPNSIFVFTSTQIATRYIFFLLFFSQIKFENYVYKNSLGTRSSTNTSKNFQYPIFNFVSYKHLCTLICNDWSSVLTIMARVTTIGLLCTWRCHTREITTDLKTRTNWATYAPCLMKKMTQQPLFNRCFVISGTSCRNSKYVTCSFPNERVKLYTVIEMIFANFLGKFVHEISTQNRRDDNFVTC